MSRCPAASRPGCRSSAGALQAGLEAYRGTVLAVTHDRGFARSFDSYLIFRSGGTVRESAEPVWD